MAQGSGTRAGRGRKIFRLRSAFPGFLAPVVLHRPGSWVLCGPEAPETTQGPDPPLRIRPLTWYFTVGVAGFEPTTSSSRTKRAAKLRYTPMSSASRRHRYFSGLRARGEIRFSGVVGRSRRVRGGWSARGCPGGAGQVWVSRSVRVRRVASGGRRSGPGCSGWCRSRRRRGGRRCGRPRCGWRGP